jgi:hypothetical protein
MARELHKVGPTAEEQSLTRATAEMQALATIVQTLAPIPELQQRAILLAVNAYFEMDKRPGYDRD